jgi:EmrB/QacA subfamily drug resistance transporter
MDSFNWRYVFYLGVPFAALGMVLAAAFLPTRRDSGPRPGFDWLGFGLLSLFLTTLLTALSNGQRWGWASDPVLGAFAIAILAAIVFVWWERHTTKPMLDLRLFAGLPFASAAVVSFIMGAGLFGSTYLLPVFVQTIQGMTPTQAGLLLMPAGFALVVVFPLAGRLTDRMRPDVLIAAGMAIFAWSSWLMADVDVNTGFWLLAWWTVLSRIGLGLVFPALSAASLRVLPVELVSQGSGAMNFSRQLGGAFGVNLLAVALERRTMFHGDALAATQTPDNATMMAFLKQIAAIAQTAPLPPDQQAGAAVWFLGRRPRERRAPARRAATAARSCRTRSRRGAREFPGARVRPRRDDLARRCASDP